MFRDPPAANVRRNKLSDFVDVRRSGIIAMKLDEDEAIVDVQICTEHDDVLFDGGRRPVHPFPRHRRAGVHGTHLDGRARASPCPRQTS